MQLPPFFRCPQAPQGNEGGDERWLITYADMITLLLVLFIILYSMANTDLEKFQALAESLREGFGATSATSGANVGSPIFDTSGGGDSPLELFPENQTPISIFEFQEMLSGLEELGGPEAGDAGDLSPQGELAQELEGIVERAIAAAEAGGIDMGDLPAGISVEFNERGIRIVAYPTQLWFASGSAVLKPVGREYVRALAGPLSQLRNRIEVQGHTDDRPINTATYPSNWELSAGRAGSVIRYLQQLGIPPERLQAAGYADTKPIADNATRQGRAMNRRVEILVLREEYEQLGPVQPAAEQPEPPPPAPEETPPVGEQ